MSRTRRCPFSSLQCVAAFLLVSLLLPSSHAPSLQILTDMGFTSIRSQGLSAPPNLAAFLVTVIACYLADRKGDRSVFMVPLALIGAVGSLILALVTSTAVRYFAVFLCACVTPFLFPILLSIPPSFLPPRLSFFLSDL
jgi:MFS family permease